MARAAIIVKTNAMIPRHFSQYYTRPPSVGTRSNSRRYCRCKSRLHEHELRDVYVSPWGSQTLSNRRACPHGNAQCAHSNEGNTVLTRWGGSGRQPSNREESQQTELRADHLHGNHHHADNGYSRTDITKDASAGARTFARNGETGFLPPLSRESTRMLLLENMPTPSREGTGLSLLDCRIDENLFPNLIETMFENRVTSSSPKVYPPLNGVHCPQVINNDDVFKTKPLSRPTTNSKSKSVVFHSAPSDRSMTYDVIKHTLESEGIDKDISRQLAERANQLCDDVATFKAKNSPRTRKKRFVLLRIHFTQFRIFIPIPIILSGLK